MLLGILVKKEVSVDFFLDHYHINLLIKLTVVYPLDVVVSKHSLFQYSNNPQPILYKEGGYSWVPK